MEGAWERAFFRARQIRDLTIAELTNRNPQIRLINSSQRISTMAFFSACAARRDDDMLTPAQTPKRLTILWFGVVTRVTLLRIQSD
jgi:hypothetical protein